LAKIKENKTKARRKSERKVELATCIPLPFLHMLPTNGTCHFHNCVFGNGKPVCDPTQNPKPKAQRRNESYTHWFNMFLQPVFIL